MVRVLTDSESLSLESLLLEEVRHSGSLLLGHGLKNLKNGHRLRVVYIFFNIAENRMRKSGGTVEE